MYELIPLSPFASSYKLIIKGQKEKEKKLEKTLKLLKIDPFYPSLKSHKVTTKHFGKRWSSWVSGDVRIIWDFDEKQKVTILLLTLAVHSGTHKEYK